LFSTAQSRRQLVYGDHLQEEVFDSNRHPSGASKPFIASWSLPVLLLLLVLRISKRPVYTMTKHQLIGGAEQMEEVAQGSHSLTI